MLRQPTPLTVDDDGRVFGHIAAWHVDHIGLPFGTRPPRSRSNYAYFHTGVCSTAEGTHIPVGQLTLAGGHASLELSANEAVKHYDDTASAVADVHAGEDAYGIWVAGGLRPGTTPEQIRALRASAPSGDWRPVQGRLELVAVCQVNVPGFPIARARVASGYVTALVAAGASAIAELRGPTVDDRIAKLEREQGRDLPARTPTSFRRFPALPSWPLGPPTSARTRRRPLRTTPRRVGLTRTRTATSRTRLRTLPTSAALSVRMVGRRRRRSLRSASTSCDALVDWIARTSFPSSG